MKILNIISWCPSLLVVLAFASCNDIVTYDENYDDGIMSHGTPIIDAVYDVDDTELTNPLTEANFGDYIMLKGENLSNVTRILMNDVEVDMTNVYVTTSSAWFAVPSLAPNEITNKLTYTTELGETQYDFTVIIPDVSVVGLNNEMAPAGSKVKVLGTNFALHGFGKRETSKVTMNGVELDVSDVSDNGMTVTLPVDAQPNSVIDVEWDGTSGHKKSSVVYASRENLMYEDWSKASNWATVDYLVENNDGLCGPYFRINTSLDAWSFNTIIGSSFILSDDAAINPQDYLFKFEVRSSTDKPFPDSGANAGLNGYVFQLGDTSNKWEWNPSKEQSFNTYGEWCTVRIELADLLASVKPQAGICSFILTLQPIADLDADHSFGGFRIEKKQASNES